MRRNKIMPPEAAAEVVLDGDTVATSGFVGIGFAEELAAALETRFTATGGPRDLTLVYAAGQGDGKNRGLNHFGHPGMVRRVIGGHWGLVPSLGRLALENRIEAYCFPQGVISHMFRDIAARRPGTITRVGLGTFVDSRLEGGRVNDVTGDDLVELIRIRDEEYLFFPAFPINVALLRGTTADEEGNVSMEKEAVTLETLSIAQAARNSGGVVIVQVERVCARNTMHPRAVHIPGILVDSVVVAEPQNHPQTFAEPYNPSYSGEIRVPRGSIAPAPLDARKVIARRAAMFLKMNSVVNLGIGMPEGVASVAGEEDILDLITLTVESGGIGGIPAGGLSFGASANAQAVIDQPYQFDFYDGGGLDQAFLGFAEVDAGGNVNVSRFGSRMAGAGGFINISQSARSLFFLGTFACGARVTVGEGKVDVADGGRFRKFVAELGQVTFNGNVARERGQTVHYVTERCVFRLAEDGLELVEVAPGMDIERDVLAHMNFRPVVPDEVAVMDPAIFWPQRMGLKDRTLMSMDDRLSYDPDENVLYVNFEGLSIQSVSDAEDLAEFLDKRFSSLGRKVNVVVNYDNFDLHPSAAERYFEMVKHNRDNFMLSSTRYSTNVFFRRQLGKDFELANLTQRFYASFDEARGEL